MQQRAANVAEMARRLRARSIKVIVYDEKIPLRYYTLDFIHWTPEGIGMEVRQIAKHENLFLWRSARTCHPLDRSANSENSKANSRNQ